MRRTTIPVNSTVHYNHSLNLKASAGTIFAALKAEEIVSSNVRTNAMTAMNCPGKKQYEMLRLMLKFSDKIQEAVEKNVHIDDIISIKSRETLARMGTVPNEEFEKRFKKLEQEMEKEIDSLIKERVK